MRTSILHTAILAASSALMMGAAHASNFQQQVAADPRGEVDISNIAGEIVISGWDRPAVSVTADVPSDSGRVRLTGGNGHTSVCVTYGSKSCNAPGFFRSGGSVRIEVHVPRGSQLDVSGVSAEIISRDVTGSQHLHTVSGDIDAGLGSGDDDVNSVSGTVRLHGSGQDGTLNVNSVSGDLSVTGVAGELEARTVNGTLRADISPARLVRLNTTSGDIALRAQLASGGSVETETVSGDQKLDVSAPGGFAYEASSFSGDVHNCFGERADKSEYGPGTRLNGTRGAGAGHVRMKTLSGEISLCDH